MPSERDYAERLRELSYKTLSPQIKDLEEEVKELSNLLTTRVQQIERKLEAVSKIELPTTDVVLNEILEDVLRRKDQEEKSIVSTGKKRRKKFWDYCWIMQIKFPRGLHFSLFGITGLSGGLQGGTPKNRPRIFQAALCYVPNTLNSKRP